MRIIVWYSKAVVPAVNSELWLIFKRNSLALQFKMGRLTDAVCLKILIMTALLLIPHTVTLILFILAAQFTMLFVFAIRSFPTQTMVFKISTYTLFYAEVSFKIDIGHIFIS